MAASSEFQRAFGTAMGSDPVFAARCDAMGFDPITLITLILPILMDMIKECWVPPATRVRLLQGKGVFAKLMVDKATAKGMARLMTTQGRDSDELRQSEVRKLSRPVLDVAAGLDKKTLLAALSN